MNSRQIKRDFCLRVCVIELPERFELLGTEWILLHCKKAEITIFAQ